MLTHHPKTDIIGLCLILDRGELFWKNTPKKTIMNNKKIKHILPFLPLYYL